jgi:hypothetical protein
MLINATDGGFAAAWDLVVSVDIHVQRSTRSWRGAERRMTGSRSLPGRLAGPDRYGEVARLVPPRW